jgi:hypothetical protein
MAQRSDHKKKPLFKWADKIMLNHHDKETTQCDKLILIPLSHPQKFFF